MTISFTPKGSASGSNLDAIRAFFTASCWELSSGELWSEGDPEEVVDEASWLCELAGSWSSENIRHITKIALVLTNLTPHGS